MVYFYCIDVIYNSEYFSIPDFNKRVSGIIECDRITNCDVYTSIYNDLTKKIFTDSIQPIYNSVSFEACTFSLIAFNPL